MANITIDPIDNKTVRNIMNNLCQNSGNLDLMGKLVDKINLSKLI